MTAMLFDEGSQAYFRAGPSWQLHVLGLLIDTWPKYLFLQLTILCIQVSHVFTDLQVDLAINLRESTNIHLSGAPICLFAEFFKGVHFMFVVLMVSAQFDIAVLCLAYRIFGIYLRLRISMTSSFTAASYVPLFSAQQDIFQACELQSFSNSNSNTDESECRPIELKTFGNSA